MENIIIDFVEAAKGQDSRNEFTKPKTRTPYAALGPLYDEYEPVDVEIVFSDLTAIHFYPQNEFPILFCQYGFDDPNVTIFASWEGDPIYIFNGQICISTHGCGKYKIDQEFNSMSDFIRWVLHNMKQPEPS